MATHFFPGVSHGQRKLAGYSPQCSKESDMTENSTAHKVSQKLLYDAAIGDVGENQYNTVK